MPRTAPGRFGVFSDEELVEAEKRSHVRFLRRLGIGPAANGRFDDINNKELSRRVARSFAEMSDREFDEAWQLGLIFFFQAEDGIRDGRVTGVQTCALPI